MRKGELIQLLNALDEENDEMLIENIKYKEENIELKLKLIDLKIVNQALRDAFKLATSEQEVEPWKLALDDDIEQYILKEGEDGREKQETHCHCGGSCKDTE